MEAISEQYHAAGKIHLVDDTLGPGYHMTACGTSIHTPEYDIVGDTAISCGNCRRTKKFKHDKERGNEEWYALKS